MEVPIKETPTKDEINQLIKELRGLAPHRPLTSGESLHVARLQASHLRRWMGVTLMPGTNLLWLTKQTAVPVNFVPSHRLNQESGMTTNAVGGKLQMFINENEAPVRQRFSLLHEFKHVLDFEDAYVLHAKLGSGDADRQGRQIEWLCNEFAANVLMPVIHVKRVWRSTQNLTLAAALFDVSTEAMSMRLERLGLTGAPKPTRRTYFRTGLTGRPPVPCLAA